jgi:hypothetical protein
MWRKAREKDLVRGAVLKPYGKDESGQFDSPYTSAIIIKVFTHHDLQYFTLIRPECWGTPAVLSGDVGCHMFSGHEFDLTMEVILEEGLVWMSGNRPELYLVKSPLLGHS